MRNRQDDKERQGKLDGGYAYFKHEDYSYIDVYRKAFENAQCSPLPSLSLHAQNYYSELVYAEAHRDYHIGSIKAFKTLNQVGAPDLELQEAKWDLFKISMSDILRNSIAGRLKCECMILYDWYNDKYYSQNMEILLS